MASGLKNHCDGLSQYEKKTMEKHNSKYFLFACAILLIVCTSGCKTTQMSKSLSRSDKKASQSLTKTIKNIASLEDYFYGFVLYDPTISQVLFEQNGHKLFTPASNNKLLTYYAANKMMGDSLPALSYLIREDSLIIRGTGDPMFLSKFDKDSLVFNFLKSSDKKIFIDFSHFKNGRFGKGWAWDDYKYLYQKEISPLPVYGNEISVCADSLNNISIIPPSLNARFTVDTSITRRIERKEYTNDVIINTLYEPLEENAVIPLCTSPDELTVLLSHAIDKEIIQINGESLEDSLFRTIYHHSTDSIYYHLLKNSDNFIAEQLILCLSGEILSYLHIQDALDTIQSILYADAPDDHRWVDGSGLSRYNLVSPYRMMWTLDKIQALIPEGDLKKNLPFGDSGTLNNIFLKPAHFKQDDPIKPFVYAKTGTLSNNHNLSGYIYTASGRKLIFSFMNNHYMHPNMSIRQNMHHILSEVYRLF